MPDLLKNMYNYESLRKLALDIQSAYDGFPAEAFLQSTMDESWDSLELKARGRQISTNLRKYLPADYHAAISIIDKVVMNYGTWLDGVFGVIFPDFVEAFGQDEINWDISIKALERYTVYASAEFAVRPFIINHEERMMAQMYAWVKHENEGVRRLASEGCRPALPWGQALSSFKKDPSPVLPILTELKADPSPHVRRSVANNLNDISKTHPDLIIQLAKDWLGQSEEIDWVVKHGCRTLLKKGNADVLAIFGFDEATLTEISGFSLEPATISVGDDIAFSFTLLAKQTAKVRLEYAIDYVKSNGKRNRKIFKISEILLRENQQKAYTKKHSFKDVSVRKHYQGTHSITLIVNGVEQGTLDFELRA